MINSKILKMKTTTTCNSNIQDILNNNMNGNKQQLNKYSQNMKNNQIGARRMYRSLVDVVIVVTLLMTILEKIGQSR
jgi:hypothetical protein